MKRNALAFVAAATVAALVTSSALACVVGTGTSVSCTEAALDACLPGGGSFNGTVTFNCGGAATITVTSTKIIDADTTLDGGSVMTISGGGAVTVFLIAGAGVTVALDNVTISGGTSLGAGGAIFNSRSTLTVTNSTFSDNHADSVGDGGAIFNNNGGTLTVTNSTFSGNSASRTGGAIFNTSGATLTVTNSTFSGNHAAADSGAIRNDGTLTVTNSTFFDNRAVSAGGAILNNGGSSTVTNCTFDANIAGLGGAIFNNNGTPTVTNSTFTGNNATAGGAIFNDDNLTVTDSTFVGNIADSDGGAFLNNSGTPTVTNCTFSGNNAGNDGGAIFNNSGSPTVTNTTFFGNGAATDGSAIFNAGTLTVTVTNSILADSTSGGNCDVSGAGGTIADGGHNIDDGETCGFTGTNCDITTGTSFCKTDPLLDPAGLASNGGPTQTIALAAGSPAINAGNETVCAVPPVSSLDQRGFVRPGVGAANCSIGAYEFNATSATETVNGQIQYYSNGLAVPGVGVHVDGVTSTVVNTDTNGTYTVSGLSPTNWTFEPQMHGGAGPAISALDAALVLQSLVGLGQLSSDQQLACDVSGNGNLSALDAALILQYLVGLIPSLPVTQSCGSDWAFVPLPAAANNQTLVEPQLGGGSCQRGAIEFQPLTSDASGQDFSAILFGDCTGNWEPPPSGVGAAFVSRSLSPRTVRLGSPRGGRGARVRFPLLVESADAFYALTAQITYDPMEFRLAGVRRGAAARGAMAQVNSSSAGAVVIALASAEPIVSGEAPTLLLDFERRRAGWMAPPHLHSASVDERPAVVF